MHSAAVALLGLTALTAATPINTLQARQSTYDGGYSVDPTLPFYLYGYAADATYTLQPFFNDAGALGLQAVVEFSDDVSDPQANFTLSANRYGSQLYAYFAEAGTEAPLVQWSNVPPTDNEPFTFKVGITYPTYGGIAFYAHYQGVDFVRGYDNYLIGYAETDLTKSFNVCDDSAGNKVLVYHGTDSSCVAVSVHAAQA